MILSRDASSPAAVAAMLRDGGWGASTMTVLEQLGGPAQRVVSGTSAGWDEPHGDPLNIIAIECTGPTRQLAPGLPDAAFTHDGQLTKQAVRALTVAALARRTASCSGTSGRGRQRASNGCDSIRAVAWSPSNATRRAPHESARTPGGTASRAVSPSSTGRRERYSPGCTARPMPSLPAAGLDAEVFRLVAGPGPGGIFVANAVAIPTQELVIGLAAEHGGTLRRIGLEEAGPLGSLTAWRPALPVVQWAVRREGR